MNADKRSKRWLATATIAIGALLLVALLAQTALALPPRPTPAPKQPAAKPAGSATVLLVQFPETWDWKETGWQNLWTVMQWEDEWGLWHDVTGWQGTLDDVEIQEDGTVVGEKGWWVPEAKFDSGPFRWNVYYSKGGALLAQSEPFNLPATVTVSLAP